MGVVIEMRAVLVSVVSVWLAAVAGCNPYDPNLPPNPFRCGDTDPVCPSGYACDSGGLCVEDGGGDPPDAQPADAACMDPAEPNNMIAQATNGAVFEQLDHIMFEGLTLCPMMDTDLFYITQNDQCGTSSPCPNLDVEMVFDELGATPAVAILNGSGTVIVPGVVTSQGVIKAAYNNVAQGMYYVRVTSQAVLPRYGLSIDGRRTQ
jgi:hypothetical protein